MRFHRRTWAQLDRDLLYDLITLRVGVFVVEQQCPYPELDGRDAEPGTVHWWTSDQPSGRGPTSYVRTLAEPGGEVRVGRVCTRAAARGSGLAGVLLTAVLAETDAARRDVVLDGQVQVAGWYARHGFTATGPEYLDDGIPHVPMRRPAAAAEVTASVREGRPAAPPAAPAGR